MLCSTNKQTKTQKTNAPPAQNNIIHSSFSYLSLYSSTDAQRHNHPADHSDHETRPAARPAARPESRPDSQIDTVGEAPPRAYGRPSELAAGLIPAHA